MIPDFLPSGLLPPGRYPTSVEEIGRILVDPFALSITRPRLHSGWQDRRRAVTRLIPVVLEWIGGSYSTAKRDPSDIDVVVFLREGDLATLNPSQLSEIVALVNGPSAKSKFGTDTYVVVEVADGHPYHDDYLRAVGYWDRWWSRTRLGEDRGYLEVRDAA